MDIDWTYASKHSTRALFLKCSSCFTSDPIVVSADRTKNVKDQINTSIYKNGRMTYEQLF